MANVLENVGERTIEHLDYVGSLNIQWWATIRAVVRAVPFVGNRYRWQATVKQVLEIGVDAMPMVSLMAICTGFILAMQGASELRLPHSRPNSRPFWTSGRLIQRHRP